MEGMLTETGAEVELPAETAEMSAMTDALNSPTICSSLYPECQLSFPSSKRTIEQ